MKTLDSEFAKCHVRNVGTYNTGGYSIEDLSTYRKLVLFQHGKKVGSSHTFSLDGYSSSGLVDYDISISSPTMLAICEFSRVRDTGRDKEHTFLVNFYNISESITEETLPISTYKIPGVHSSDKYPKISFVDDFKLVILSPCETLGGRFHKLSIIDLLGMRTLAETSEFQSVGIPWCLSVNSRYVAFMASGEIPGADYCYVYDKKLTFVNKFIVSNERDSSLRLSMREPEKVIVTRRGFYEVYNIKSGVLEFTMFYEQIKTLLPAILNDVHMF
jgi:hypothetical protein